MDKGSEFVCNHVTKADDEYDYLLFVFKENIKCVQKKQVKYEIHKSIRFFDFVIRNKELSKSFSSKKIILFYFRPKILFLWENFQTAISNYVILR